MNNNKQLSYDVCVWILHFKHTNSDDMYALCLNDQGLETQLVTKMGGKVSRLSSVNNLSYEHVWSFTMCMLVYYVLYAEPQNKQTVIKDPLKYALQVHSEVSVICNQSDSLSTSCEN